MPHCQSPQHKSFSVTLPGSNSGSLNWLPFASSVTLKSRLAGIPLVTADPLSSSALTGTYAGAFRVMKPVALFGPAKLLVTCVDPGKFFEDAGSNVEALWFEGNKIMGALCPEVAGWKLPVA